MDCEQEFCDKGSLESLLNHIRGSNIYISVIYPVVIIILIRNFCKKFGAFQGL